MLEVTNSELNNVYEKLKKLITDSNNELGNKIDILANELKETANKVKFLENENKLLKHEIQECLRERKKNNVIIFGIEEEEPEDVYSIVLDLFNNLLGTSVSKTEINCAYRFGRQLNKKRPIVVKFVTLHKKFYILKKEYLLKGSSISITNDSIKEDRDKQKILRRHLKNALDQGLVAKIRKNNLIVNDVIYSIDQLLELENKQVEQQENKQAEKPEVKTQKTKNVHTTKEASADKDKKIATSSIKKHSETKSKIIYGLRSCLQTPAAGSSTEAGRETVR